MAALPRCWIRVGRIGLLILAACHAAPPPAARLNVSLDPQDGLSINIDDVPYLAGGASAVTVRHRGRWFSNDCTFLKDSHECTRLRLVQSHSTLTAGSDALEELLGTYQQRDLAWQRGLASTSPAAGSPAEPPRTYQQRDLAWQQGLASTSPAAGSPAEPPLVVTGIRTYDDAAAGDVAVLTQRFPGGLEPQNKHGKTGEIVSAFPSIGESLVDSLAVVWYEGVQLQNSRVFRWSKGEKFAKEDPGASGSKQADGDGSGMPVVMTAPGGHTIVFSPLEDFFTATQARSEQLGGNLSMGLQGTLQEAPANHTHSTLVVAGRGLRATMMRWGDIMMRWNGGGKVRSLRAGMKARDAAMKTLSYYTDNGAFYYYQTANGTGSCSPPHAPCPHTIPELPFNATGYRGTMDLLQAHFAELRLPVRNVQLDSWWYYKGNSGGIDLWEPMPSTLGGPEVRGAPPTWYHYAKDNNNNNNSSSSSSSMRTVAHSRWFQSDSAYLTGKAPDLPADWRNWSWLVDDASKVAVSTDPAFFGHIFRRAKAGLQMFTYEQDFLAHSYESVQALQTTVGAGKAWLAGMAEAAEAENITLQYCMALPRHILQSASHPRVTHARASHDYGQSRSDDTEQWSSIGLTSILYWALGLVPFKDDFWSETTQPGNHWGTVAAREADPELQAVVSALTAGPVGPAGEIGYINRTRVMQTCMADGTLLKPLAPAMQLDSSFEDVLETFIGVDSVWGTTMAPAAASEDGPLHASIAAVHYLLLFVNVSSPEGYTVTVDELAAIGEVPGDGSRDLGGGASFVAREYYSGELRVINALHPLHVDRMDNAQRPSSCRSGGFDLRLYCNSFELWSVAPVATAGWVILGETDKFVGLSAQRFAVVSSSLPNVQRQKQEEEDEEEREQDDKEVVEMTVHGSPGEIVNVGLLDCRDGACAAPMPGQESTTNAFLGSRLVVVQCEIAPGASKATLRCGAVCACR